MTQAELVAKLADLPTQHWRAACCRCRWLYARFDVEKFDLSGLPPALAAWLKKRPPETAWRDLRLAVTRRRRADAAKGRRHKERDRAIYMRTYKREYMQRWRKRQKEATK